MWEGSAPTMLETANWFTPSPGNASTRPDANRTCAHSDRSAVSYQRPPIVPRCSCKTPGRRCEMHGAAKIRPPLLLIRENRQEAVEAVRSPNLEVPQCFSNVSQPGHWW